jgi:hypothetical protein
MSVTFPRVHDIFKSLVAGNGSAFHTVDNEGCRTATTYRHVPTCAACVTSCWSCSQLSLDFARTVPKKCNWDDALESIPSSLTAA